MKHDASVHVSVELKERLDALSRRVRRDVSDIAAEALNEYLDAASASLRTSSSRMTR